MNADNHLIMEAMGGRQQQFVTSHLHKVHTTLNQLSTIIHLNRSAEADQLLSKIRDMCEMLMQDSPAEDAEQYEQNRIVGNTVMQDDQEIGVFLGDSYSSKLTLNGKEMFMPGAPYAQTINQGTHMGLWYVNRRHRLIVKDASKWKEFLSDIVSTGDDKYWDGKKMHQHDHMGDKIAADEAYWSKKIAAGADQRAEDAEGASDQEYHRMRKDALTGAGEELGDGPIKLQLLADEKLDCYKAGAVQSVRFAKGTIFNCVDAQSDF